MTRHTSTKVLQTLCFTSIFAMVLMSTNIAQAQSNEDNWLGSDGTVWRIGDGMLCWRTPFWTPATGNSNCDGRTCRDDLPTTSTNTAPYPSPKASVISDDGRDSSLDF